MKNVDDVDDVRSVKHVSIMDLRLWLCCLEGDHKYDKRMKTWISKQLVDINVSILGETPLANLFLREPKPISLIQWMIEHGARLRNCAARLHRASIIQETFFESEPLLLDTLLSIAERDGEPLWDEEEDSSLLSEYVRARMSEIDLSILEQFIRLGFNPFAPLWPSIRKPVETLMISDEEKRLLRECIYQVGDVVFVHEDQTVPHIILDVVCKPERIHGPVEIVHQKQPWPVFVGFIMDRAIGYQGKVVVLVSCHTLTSMSDRWIAADDPHLVGRREMGLNDGHLIARWKTWVECHSVVTRMPRHNWEDDRTITIYQYLSRFRSKAFCTCIHRVMKQLKQIRHDRSLLLPLVLRTFPSVLCELICGYL